MEIHHQASNMDTLLHMKKPFIMRNMEAVEMVVSIIILRSLMEEMLIMRKLLKMMDTMSGNLVVTDQVVEVAIMNIMKKP